MITKTSLVSVGTIIYGTFCILVNIHNFCCTIEMILQYVTDLKIYKNREILSHYTKLFCNFGFYPVYAHHIIN